MDCFRLCTSTLFVYWRFATVKRSIIKFRCIRMGPAEKGFTFVLLFIKKNALLVQQIYLDHWPLSPTINEVKFCYSVIQPITNVSAGQCNVSQRTKCLRHQIWIYFIYFFEKLLLYLTNSKLFKVERVNDVSQIILMAQIICYADRYNIYRFIYLLYRPVIVDVYHNLHKLRSKVSRIFVRSSVLRNYDLVFFWDCY